ncbi:MAG: UDP-N-acetylglucosamine--N-acetylmuramyl-(pentapeptide) pyrophosphoryl-undecaprenol N-acetylglucosamine transferase [Acidobacteriota bacterium]
MTTGIFPRRRASKGPSIWIAGGGSGGHVFPGLAVADELTGRGVAVGWVGGRGMERGLVERHGLPFLRRSARPLVGRGPLGKLRALATLAISALRTGWSVQRRGVRAVLGTGGYVSAPAVLGARLAGRPTLLLEPNAEPGVANVLLSRLATEALVASSAGAARLRCRVIEVGVPVRAGFFEIGPLPPAPPIRLLVLGGSQGAQHLNRVLPQALERLAAEAPDLRLSVVHQTGAAQAESARSAHRAVTLDDNRIAVEVVEFLHDMPAAMRAAHCILGRAGAITLAEICAAGRPSLLLPLHLAGGHQEANARRLERAGAACVLANEPALSIEDDARRMAAALRPLVEDLDRLHTMGDAARSLSRPDAAPTIADRVAFHAGLGGHA